MNDDPDSTSLHIEIAVLDPLWRGILANLPSSDERDELTANSGGAIRQAAVAAFTTAAPEALRRSRVEISLVLGDDAHVQTLNRDYRGFDKPTNVLSFAAFDDADPVPAEHPILLGDVVLARETVSREADLQDKLITDHVSHLVVHGVLHLLGFDHETDEDAEEMEGLEIAILAKLRIGNPYRNDVGAAAATGLEQTASSR